ncbi:helix-turn-helix domain-containing protein [Streptomyces sp. NPDC002125]
MALPSLHTPKDVADALKVSAWWVREQAKAGHVPAVKIAGTWRFTDHQVQLLVDLHTTTPETAPAVEVTPRRRADSPAPALALVPRIPRRAAGQ